MRYPQACLLLFAREPVPGRVKTRLIPALGDGGAADLHQQLVRRQLAWLNASTLCPSALWVDGDPAHALFQDFPGPRLRQQGAGLGARMAHAAARALAGSEYAVIIGSDCPSLGEDYVAVALERLADGADVVLGPAEDGGYVLIGLRRLGEDWFEGIDWGTSRVLAQTVDKLRAAGVTPALLSPLRDIDRPEDLGQLPDCDIFPIVSRRYLA